MQFKLAIVFAAALCAAQAASFEQHERNRRAAENLLSKATSMVSSWKENIQNKANEGIAKIWSTAESMEEKVLDTANGLLKKVGANVDLKALTEIVKGNVKSCATSDSIKAEALKIKDELFSCVGSQVATISEIVADVGQLAVDNADAPEEISEAVTICKGNAGEAFTMERLAKCGAALKDIIGDENLQAVPAAIAKNVQKAAGLVAEVATTGASCLKSKLASTGISLAGLAKNLASCVKTGVTTGSGAEALAKAAPMLANFKFASLLG